jgi:hypothetical protein
MRYVNITVLLLIATVLVAAEDPEAVEESASSVPVWVGILGTALTALLGWIATLFRKKVKTDAEKAQIDKTKSVWEQKNQLIDQRIKPFAIDTAEHWLITNITPLLIDAADGGGFRWKDHLKDLKAYTKDRVLKKFARENVDVLEHFAEEDLDHLLDRILAKTVGNLPESVTKFLPDSVIEKLKDYAIEFAKEEAQDLAK